MRVSPSAVIPKPEAVETAGAVQFEPVRDLLKPYGQAPAPAVLSRWVHKGVGGAKRLGNRLLSARQWVRDFV
ncbi:MAG: hypothetical protein K8U03_03060 [Planctomycetia bacterium]|nr:hypothetical protein [Planctomycetia bacterium]